MYNHVGAIFDVQLNKAKKYHYTPSPLDTYNCIQILAAQKKTTGKRADGRFAAVANTVWVCYELDEDRHRSISGLDTIVMVRVS